MRAPSSHRVTPAPIRFHLDAAAVERERKRIDALALVPRLQTLPTPYMPNYPTPAPPGPKPGDALGPPLLEVTARAEGGATCTVRFTLEHVFKSCPKGDMSTEFELTQRAKDVLGEARVVHMELSDDGRTLSIERLGNGDAFQNVRGYRPFWTGDDSPKVGQLRNFTPEAKAQLRADVERLHANGLAHNDIHAGNVGIVSVDDAGEVTDAMLIDYSEMVDMERLADVPTTMRDVSRGWNTGADWKTPYVEHLMARSFDTAEGLFEAAKTYDLNRLAMMGV